MTFRFDICEINCKHCSQFKRCILDLWVKTCLALLAVCIWGLYLFTERFMLMCSLIKPHHCACFVPYSRLITVYNLGRQKCTAQHNTKQYVLSWEAPLRLLSGESEVLCIIQHHLTYTIELWVVNMRRHTPVQYNRHKRTKQILCRQKQPERRNMATYS